jgi:gamma-glutamyltranspeptidase/glutathione hydrolase
MRGVIAAGDPKTAQTGADILRIGGNAVDAAVAAAFVSFIAEIGVVHLGGSGIAQIFDPYAGSSHVATTYDFFSVMPGLGGERSKEQIDFQEVLVDFGPTTQSFFLGRGSVAVPGNIFGLCKMASEHGRLPLPQLLEPAIELAQNGHRLRPFQAATCELLSPLYTNTESMRQIFLKEGRMIQTGELLCIPDLAETLQELAIHGSQAVRNGFLSDAIVADQEVNGGLITKGDFERFEVRLLKPISIRYRDYEVLLPPPSSSGGVLTAFTLKLLSNFEVSDHRHGSAEYLRLLFEIMAATTRARPFLDRALDDLPISESLAYFLADYFIDRYVEEVRSALKNGPSYPALSEQSDRPDTSHISVIDGDGLAVSLTTTAGESAGYVVPGTGMITNNILGEADLHPAGFHKRPPGQSIPTMMTPTFVLKDGNIRLVVGSGGSIRIRSAILQVLSNLLDFKMRLVNAVNSSRVHLEDGVLQCEQGFDEQAVDQLQSWGYPVNRWDKRSIYFGGAHSVSRTESGQLVASGDNRRGGAVATVE